MNSIVTSSDAKRNFGRILETTMKGPVEITKSGRRVAVILSAEDYDNLSRLEDAYWGERALAAEKGGFVGPEEAMRTLTRMRHEEA
ncbi:type II toxin-antitoxin system Phd/YefM family antitoxin [Desulfovibrio sulfodismutans]|uniref:Antitoxin n=3 Tax=root TaxID=1 RepID=A0A7K3NSV5_9BACT|nr:type II toxin-antitoxin system Phd/YefM family antitoxin [Desulfolutivibrio sulfodismutans]QLA14355.1 type II toxin-antitoxin system prevent-host-death family antitoxin [Desulfolutivibrio sulfodismutans DSM 3696]